MEHDKEQNELRDLIDLHQEHNNGDVAPPPTMLRSVLRLLSDVPRSKIYADSIPARTMLRLSRMGGPLYRQLCDDITELCDDVQADIVRAYGHSVKKLTITGADGMWHRNWIAAVAEHCTGLKVIEFWVSYHRVAVEHLLEIAGKSLERLQVLDTPIESGLVRALRHVPHLEHLAISVLVTHASAFEALLMAVGDTLLDLTVNIRDQSSLLNDFHFSHTSAEHDDCTQNMQNAISDKAVPLSMKHVGAHCTKLQRLELRGDLGPVLADMDSILEVQALQRVEFEYCSGVDEFMQSLAKRRPEVNVAVDMQSIMQDVEKHADLLLAETVDTLQGQLFSLRCAAGRVPDFEKGGKCKGMLELDVCDVHSDAIFDAFGKTLGGLTKLSIGCCMKGKEAVALLEDLASTTGKLVAFKYEGAEVLPANAFDELAMCNEGLVHVSIRYDDKGNDEDNNDDDDGREVESEDDNSEAGSENRDSEAESEDGDSEAASEEDDSEADSKDDDREDDSDSADSDYESDDDNSEAGSGDDDSEAESKDDDSEAASEDDDSEADSDDANSEAENEDDDSKVESEDDQYNEEEAMLERVCGHLKAFAVCKQLEVLSVRLDERTVGIEEPGRQREEFIRSVQKLFEKTNVTVCLNDDFILC